MAFERALPVRTFRTTANALIRTLRSTTKRPMNCGGRWESPKAETCVLELPGGFRGVERYVTEARTAEAMA